MIIAYSYTFMYMKVFKMAAKFYLMSSGQI